MLGKLQVALTWSRLDCSDGSQGLLGAARMQCETDTGAIGHSPLNGERGVHLTVHLVVAKATHPGGRRTGDECCVNL